jgi:hypothetical protein
LINNNVLIGGGVANSTIGGNNEYARDDYDYTKNKHDYVKDISEEFYQYSGCQTL